eukprot:1342273-Amorphochlora_amoeboformis.AAC.1
MAATASRIISSPPPPKPYHHSLPAIRPQQCLKPRRSPQCESKSRNPDHTSPNYLSHPRNHQRERSEQGSRVVP